MDLLAALKYKNLFFLILYLEKFQPVSLKAQKIIKFSFFQSFWLIFKNFALWLFGDEDICIKCLKQFSYYIEFIYRRLWQKKFKSDFHVFNWFPGTRPPKCRYFLENLLYKLYYGNNFQPEVIPYNLLLFGFLIVVSVVWKNQTRELGTLIRWVLG